MTLSVVVPVFNEEAVLVECQRRLAAVLAGLGATYEIIYVDDGSTDQTIHLLKRLQRSHPGTSYARLTRNFGKEAAMSAGLKLATGEAVVVIDADLQDPPEFLPEMVAAWRGGADVVNMRRSVRLGESWWHEPAMAAAPLSKSRSGAVR